MPKTQTKHPDAPTLRPLGDRVLVRRDRTPEKEGQLYLPESTRQSRLIPRVGEVLAVGPGKLQDDGTRRLTNPVQVGARVYIDYRQGSSVNDVLQDGDKDVHYLLLPSDAILALEEA